MLDKTKTIIGLILAVIALLMYAARLEHRLTVMEQNDILIQTEIKLKLEQIDDNQRRMMQVMFFNQVE